MKTPPINELSTRGRSALMQLVLDTKAGDVTQLLAALWDNPRILDRQPGCGPGTRDEVCAWLGFPYDAAIAATPSWQSNNSAAEIRQAIRLLKNFGFEFKFKEHPPRDIPPGVLPDQDDQQ